MSEFPIYYTNSTDCTNATIDKTHQSLCDLFDVMTQQGGTFTAELNTDPAGNVKQMIIPSTLPPLNVDFNHKMTAVYPESIMTNKKKSGLYTTVKWSDGSYTTVKASQDDAAEPSVYMAFCAALAKKLYGSNAAVHRIVTRSTKEYQDAQKAKEAAEKRAKEREAEQAAHERALLREAKRLRLKAEAKAYNAAHQFDKE